MSNSEILSDFQVATTAAVAASSVPTLPIKYVGLTFIPPNDDKYLECVFLPNNFDNEYWGQSRTFRGVFRLLLHWGFDGGGPYVPITLIEQITATAFYKGRRFLSGVQIVNNPNLGSQVEVQSRVIWPASIDYQLFRE